MEQNQRKVFLLIITNPLFPALVACLWFLIFPNVSIALKVICAVFTFFPLIQFLADIRKNKGKMKFSSLLFLAVPLFFLGPDMFFQEKTLKHIKAMKGDEISFVEISLPNSVLYKITDRSHISHFASLIKKAILFNRDQFPNILDRELSVREFELSIHFSGGKNSLLFHSEIPEFHLQDFTISFTGLFLESEILIPEGGEWLNEIAHVPHKKSSETIFQENEN